MILILSRMAVPSSQVSIICIRFAKLLSKSMASSQNSQHSPQHSRVSSTSSNHSHSYELIPRQQPFSNPQRDLPSPRASFPFRKVQPGFESSIANNSHNDSRHTFRNSRQHEHSESKELIEAIGEINSSKIIRKNLQEQGRGIRMHENLDLGYSQRIRQLQQKIIELERIMQTERMDFQMEKKANEIYTEGFKNIRELVLSQDYHLEGQSIEELVERLTDIFQKLKEVKKENHLDSEHRGVGRQQLQIIEQQELKIRQLRGELLRSSQNNINAIFNTEITEAHCLHLQIKKMNAEINTLKENLIRATAADQSNDKNKEHKIVNIYHHKLSIDSSDDEEINRELRVKKHHYSNKNRRERRESSSSDKAQKSRILKNTESRMGELLDGYKILREEYKRLQSTLQQLNLGQTDYRHMFQTLKQQISASLQQQITEVKQTLRRPSSSHSQKKLAQDLESKLNHLVNTLNAPEKVNIERSLGEDSVTESKSVELYRRTLQLQARNSHLQRQMRQLQSEKFSLQEKLMQSHRITSKEALKYQRVDPMGNSNRNYELDDLLDSRSDIKEQEIVQQLGNDMNAYCIHTSSINKLHSSQSYHQSNHKTSSEAQQLRKIQFYKEELRMKDLRITELENTIFDHLHTRTVQQPSLSKDQLREKYEHYIANLKILLQEAKRENQIIRHELIKVSELNISRANDQDHYSITLSDRTTKNPIAQTRMIRRRNPNNYQAIQLKLHIQQEIEKLFLALLNLYQKVLSLKQQDRKQLDATLSGCINWLVSDARGSSSKLFEQTLQKEHVKGLLSQLGLIKP